MEDTSSLEDTDIDSSVNLLKEIEEATQAIQLSISDCKKHTRQILSKVKETQPPILHLKLKPRSSTKAWIQSHGLSEEEVTIQEFLDTFLTIYRNENRLDISTLSVDLRKEEAKLFHLPAGKTNYFEILAALPTLFH